MSDERGASEARARAPSTRLRARRSPGPGRAARVGTAHGWGGRARRFRGRDRGDDREVLVSPLSDSELERYSRQLVLPEWSGEAQARLKSASVIVVGVGALGSPAAMYLAAAGVGNLGVVDSDVVELSNLHRQPLHFTPDLGLPKASNAVIKLSALNPAALVQDYPVRLEEANAEAIVTGADLVVDCSDSFETRYLVNDACCAQSVALVEAGVLGFDGLVMSIRPGVSACYRCAFPTQPAPGSVP